MAPLAKQLNRVYATEIWIADPHHSDYDCLKRGARRDGLAVRFLDSAYDVLHRWPSALPDVCMINVRLPGLSGFDLVEMLRPFPPGTTVGLVADAYSRDDEVRALSLGVHFFLCKPLGAEMLSTCCRKQRSAKNRRRAEACPAAARRCPD